MKKNIQAESGPEINRQPVFFHEVLKQSRGVLIIIFLTLINQLLSAGALLSSSVLLSDIITVLTYFIIIFAAPFYLFVTGTYLFQSRANRYREKCAESLLLSVSSALIIGFILTALTTWIITLFDLPIAGLHTSISASLLMGVYLCFFTLGAVAGSVTGSLAIGLILIAASICLTVAATLMSGMMKTISVARHLHPIPGALLFTDGTQIFSVFIFCIVIVPLLYLLIKMTAMRSLWIRYLFAVCAISLSMISGTFIIHVETRSSLNAVKSIEDVSSAAVVRILDRDRMILSITLKQSKLLSIIDGVSHFTGPQRELFKDRFSTNYSFYALYTRSTGEISLLGREKHHRVDSRIDNRGEIYTGCIDDHGHWPAESMDQLTFLANLLTMDDLLQKIVRWFDRRSGDPVLTCYNGSGEAVYSQRISDWDRHYLDNTAWRPESDELCILNGGTFTFTSMATGGTHSETNREIEEEFLSRSPMTRYRYHDAIAFLDHKTLFYFCQDFKERNVTVYTLHMPEMRWERHVIECDYQPFKYWFSRTERSVVEKRNGRLLCYAGENIYVFSKDNNRIAWREINLSGVSLYGTDHGYAVLKNRVITLHDWERDRQLSRIELAISGNNPDSRLSSFRGVLFSKEIVLTFIEARGGRAIYEIYDIRTGRLLKRLEGEVTVQAMEDNLIAYEVEEDGLKNTRLFDAASNREITLYDYDMTLGEYNSPVSPAEEKRGGAGGP